MGLVPTCKIAIALIKKLQPDWWIVENVASMKKDQKDIFTERFE